jgi:hypothetical protein
VAPVSSLADAASPMILMFLRLNLHLNLCNHSLLALKCMASSSVSSFSWKSSHRLKDFAVTRCRQRVPSFNSYLPPRNLRLSPPSLILYHAQYNSNICSNTGLQPLCPLSLSLSKNNWWTWPRVKWTLSLSLVERGAREKVWIYIYGPNNHDRPSPPYYRGFMITLGHTSIGSTPLDEWPAQRWDRHLITHNPQFQQASSRTSTP